MNIKFLVFYDIDEFESEKRNNPLSSRTVVDYICQVLNSLGHQVEIVSPSETFIFGKYFKSRTTEINENKKVTLGPTIGARIKLLNAFFKAVTRLWFVLYLLKNIKKGDRIFIWHQIPLMMPINLLYPFIKNKVKKIWCIGELYYKVNPERFNSVTIKEQLFLKKGDKYILSTKGILKYENINSNDCIVLPGNLSVFDQKESIFDDDKIHIVYSGVLNSTKGVKQAISIANYLSDQYVVHILGWASSQEVISDLNNKINEINKKGFCQVKYEGVLKGNKYIQFLCSCDIGLCSQDIDTTYNDCSFPSKVLSYLGCGLRVVCSDIEAVRDSELANHIYFCENNEPKILAEKILNISKDYIDDPRKKLTEMNISFRKSLQRIIE